MNNSIKQNHIVYWLFFNAFMIICMVFIGGVTRLTDSGLSMIDWNLFKGIIPPTNDQDWEVLFNKYKKFPEYKVINFNISLDDFKQIFFWEYFHRIWGRLIGLTFLVPFIYYLIKKSFTKNARLFLYLILALGCFQGFMGWYMVQSGLVDKPDVSQYRLAAHLSIAFILYTSILFLAWNIYRSQKINYSTRLPSFKNAVNRTSVCFILTFLTAIFGAFVAGTNAGLAYNNFPYMGESILHPDAFILEPAWKNMFENVSLIQFNHRLLASITTIVIIICSYLNYKYIKDIVIKRLSIILGFSIFLQYCLGIITLKLLVPIALGAIHQLGSLFVLTILTLMLSEFYSKKKGEI